jgi:hypothetical protein
MIFIYDNLTAMIIAMAVLLLLVTIQFRTTQANIAQTSRNIVKEQAQSFATWVEDDLERIGENVSPGDVTFENPVDSAGITTSFTFYRDSIESTTSIVPVSTRYTVRKIDTRIVEEDTLDIYQLDREQKVGSGSWTLDGQSIGALGYFEVDMLNRNAQPIQNPKYQVQSVNPDTVRSTRVRFSVVAPYQTDQTSLRVVHFGSVLLLRNEN